MSRLLASIGIFLMAIVALYLKNVIKRKIYNDLCRWKDTAQGSKALLIEGARRIGKSTVTEEFGKNEYKSYILIDFNKAGKKVKDLFDDMSDIDIFFQH